MLHRVRPLNKSFCLQTLCENNYRKLVSLIPCFEQLETNGVVKTTVLAKAPFTYHLSLTFGDLDKSGQHSNIECRVYLDTQSVDVLNIAGLSSLTQAQKSAPKKLLQHKWEINYFFEKWLVFQLQRANEEPLDSQASLA
ncbi:MAG: DUF1249 domain-containing protein [Cycloclasticus sp.]